MCCVITALLLLGPRLAIIIWWLVDPTRFNLAFHTWTDSLKIALPGCLWPVLGFLFVPWTTLAYLLVFPGGVTGLDWVVLALGLILDLSAHGSGYRHRDRMRG